MATNLLISGGPGHDFDATSAVLAALLAEVDVRSTVFDDPREGLGALAEQPHRWDLVTVNALRWKMETERYAPLRARWAFTVRDHELAAIEGHVRSGGGLLACHAAAISFDGDPRWRSCIGATWNWDRSSHPPLGAAHIVPTVAGAGHPLTVGIEAFTTTDEVYGFLDSDPALVPLLTSAHGGTDHPVLWARTVGRGRVVTDLLGHDTAAMTHPDHGEILRRAARWLTAAGPSQPGQVDLDGSDATP